MGKKPLPVQTWELNAPILYLLLLQASPPSSCLDFQCVGNAAVS